MSFFKEKREGYLTKEVTLFVSFMNKADQRIMDAI